METLSIVIPVRNRAALLRRCLMSVARQTYRPLQVVVVDNGSTDNSTQVAVEWGKQVSAPNLEVQVFSEMRQGAAAARYAGAMQASGSVLAFVDSDDTIRPEYAQSIMDIFNKNAQAELVYWRKQSHDSTGRSRKLRFTRRLTMGAHVAHGILNTLGCAVRAGLYHRSGGWDTSLHQWDDWELGIRYISALQGEAVRIDKVLVDIYTHADSITGENYRNTAGEWEIAIAASVRHAKTLTAPDSTRLLRLAAFKQTILAAHYKREGERELGRSTLQAALALLPDSRGTRVLRYVYAYTGSGLRGAATWAIPLLK